MAVTCDEEVLLRGRNPPAIIMVERKQVVDEENIMKEFKALESSHAESAVSVHSTIRTIYNTVWTLFYLSPLGIWYDRAQADRVKLILDVVRSHRDIHRND